MKALVQTDVWSGSGANDPGEHIGRKYHEFDESFVRFMAGELNKGNHLNMRLLTKDETANVQRLAVQ